MNNRKLGNYFLLATTLLLFSPFISELGRPLNNPFTPFADYPLPLQEAYAETQIGTITRGEDWSTEIIAANSTSVIKKHILGLPEFILVNGKYINAKTTEDKDFVYVDSRTSAKISKTTCSFEEFEKGRIIDNISVRKITDYTILVSSDAVLWNDVIGNKVCNSVTSFTNATGTFVTTVQTIGKHTLETTYAWYENQELPESFLTPENNGNAQYIAVKEIQKSQDSNEEIVIDTNEYEVSNTSITQTTDDNATKVMPSYTETKQTLLDHSMLYQKQDSKDLVYDTKGADEFLDSITISQKNGKLVTEILYTKKDVKLQPGQSYTIDPTFGYTAGTFTQPIDNNTCDGTSASTNSQRMVGGDGSNCYRVTEEWDTTSIADGSDVTNVNFKYDISAIDAGSPNCDVVTLSVQPSVSTLLQEQAAIIAGSVYSAIDCNNTQTGTVVDLGTTADTNVENLLTSNYFAFGIRKNPDDNAGNRASFANNQLEVTYALSIKQQVKFKLFESNGTTAVASASIIVKNSTATTTLTTNSTGVTPALGLNTVTNHNVTGKTSTSYVVYKQFNWQPTANQTETRTGNIYDVTGCTVTISNVMMNDTDRHYVASVPLTPTCTSDVLTFNYFYKRTGIGSAGTNQTTTIRFEVPTTSRYAGDMRGTVNGTSIAFTYSAGVVTSGTIQVDNGANNVILKVRIPLLQYPNAVTTLTSPDQTTSTIELLWSQPILHGHALQGYQINYTTPHGTPLTRLVNNTNSSSVNYIVSGLTYATNYTFRVSAWTLVGNNATGNQLNTQTEGDTFTVGSIVVNQTNTNIVDIRFERIDINDTALFLNVTYSSTFDLACDFTYKFARINQTYTNLSNVTISPGIVESSFLFTGVDNEVIDVLCWDQDSAHVPSASVGAGAGNYTHAGRYILTQTQFPLQDQINNFRNGVYGTEGRFGVLDFITLGVIIVSMIGFNRVNETVGVVFNIILLGVLAYFEVIVLPTIVFGVIATVIVLVVSTTKKD